jgi:hypothetical protein
VSSPLCRRRYGDCPAFGRDGKNLLEGRSYSLMPCSSASPREGERRPEVRAYGEAVALLRACPYSHRAGLIVPMAINGGYDQDD